MLRPTDIKTPAKEDYEGELNQLENKYGMGTCNYNDVEQMAQEMLSTIPKLDRDLLREEMGLMHVDVYVDPTTFNINEGLALAQSYRERLAGILALADREYNIRTKVFEMLLMAHSVTSKASSADKRKGEGLIKYAVQFIQLEAAETFRNEVKTFLENMRSTSETISRQASVLQAQIALGEVRRKSDNNFIQAEMNLQKPVEEFQW